MTEKENIDWDNYEANICPRCGGDLETRRKRTKDDYGEVYRLYEVCPSCGWEEE